MKKIMISILATAFLLSAGYGWAQNKKINEEEARRITAEQGLFYALADDDITAMGAMRDQGANPNTSLARSGLKGKNVFQSGLPIFKEKVNTSAWPILTWAVYLDNLDAAALLIRAGAMVNGPDAAGGTPLHWAAWGGRHEIAKLLLNNGANCMAKDARGLTPKDWAVMTGQNDIVRLMEGRGCRPPKDQDGDGVPDQYDLCPNTPLGAPVDERGCWVVAYSSFFDFDKAVVKSRYLPHLKNAAGILSNNPQVFVEIEGHTDSVGTDEYNYSLGLRRAEAVKAVLVKYGVASDRLSAFSKGETKPIADNNTDSGRSRNRRVELHVAQPEALGLVDQSAVPGAIK